MYLTMGLQLFFTVGRLPNYPYRHREPKLYRETEKDLIMKFKKDNKNSVIIILYNLLIIKL